VVGVAHGVVVAAAVVMAQQEVLPLLGAKRPFCCVCIYMLFSMFPCGFH
jgi:hypothetical protein